MMKNRRLEGYPNAEKITNEQLLALDVDILVPAAIDGVITRDNMKNVKAKIISEGANGPITSEAQQYLEGQGVYIIPEFRQRGRRDCFVLRVGTGTSTVFLE